MQATQPCLGTALMWFTPPFGPLSVYAVTSDSMQYYVTGCDNMQHHVAWHHVTDCANRVTAYITCGAAYHSL